MARGEYGALRPKTSEEGAVVSGEIEMQKKADKQIAREPQVVVKKRVTEAELAAARQSYYEALDRRTALKGTNLSKQSRDALREEIENLKKTFQGLEADFAAQTKKEAADKSDLARLSRTIRASKERTAHPEKAARVQEMEEIKENIKMESAASRQAQEGRSEEEILEDKAKVRTLRGELARVKEEKAEAKAEEERVSEAASVQAMTSERALMADKGVVVEKRLDAIRDELKQLGYDIDVHPAKAPFWGSLTKKGRLIIEFNKLAGDENYQYLLQVREDNKHRTEAEKKKQEERLERRAMGYRAGTLAGRAAPEETETREEREQENVEEKAFERRMERGTLTEADRVKEGNRINKIIKGIENDLKGYSLSLADLAKPMDRKTAKMLKNAGIDVGKLRTEYFSLLDNPDYKFWLDQKEK